jgi:hypothetical protein
MARSGRPSDRSSCAREQLTRSLLLAHKASGCVHGGDFPISLTGVVLFPRRERRPFEDPLEQTVNIAGTAILLRTEFL